MDRFDAMAMFLAAVDHGSLSAAARALKVPVPTLSRKVADLEAAEKEHKYGKDIALADLDIGRTK